MSEQGGRDVSTQERSSLERRSARGSSVSTEDLRVSLQRNRQFFQTLLRD